MNKNDAFEKLRKLVSIQSVSTDPSRRSELDKAADFIKEEFKSMGCEVIFYREENCPPLIIGKKTISETTPTVGIYTHYDVQPETPMAKWESPPFKLTRRGEKLYGRGVADDKMHIVQSITAVKNLVKNNRLNNNLVFIFEGEEERGSLHFESLVKKARQAIGQVDAFYILDMGMKAKNVPQIFYALRGIGCYKLTMRIGETDLHSGIYGNRVLNPAQIAAELFAKMKDGKGRINIPGFHDKVKKFEGQEIKVLSRFVPDPDEERKNAGVKEFAGDYLKSKIEPSIEINGIASGHAGEGFKTIIPAEAVVKFSVRVVEHQKGKEVNEIIKKFVAENIPAGIDYELEDYGVSDPFFTDYNNSYTVKTAKILEEIFGNECYYNRSGGSIAAAEILQRVFGKPIILTGFTLPDENIHAPNENVDIEMFSKGIRALEGIFVA